MSDTKTKLPKKKAKIIATMGPTCNSLEQIEALALAGMDVARLNFSHGSHTDHKQVIDNIRSVSNKLNKPIAILQDLQGPKIRTGKLKQDVELITGQTYSITTEDILGDEKIVSTTYKNLADDLSVGDLVLVDDGSIHLKVIAVEKPVVQFEVVFGGTLKNNKGINLPFLKLSTPALTDKDKIDLEFGIQCQVDYVALSFVREAADVIELRELIKTHTEKYVPIISKVEKPQALENIDGIIDASDGIMVARGDLGVELQLEKVPMAQKSLIEKSSAKNKIVITATQMLDSMIRNPSPTRAEASDVANAIMDGTDAVMLSGETANGAFPVQAVEMMAKLVEETESSSFFNNKFSHHISLNNLHLAPIDPPEFQGSDNVHFTRVISNLSCIASESLNAKAIIVLTDQGRIAKQISKGCAKCPIIALSPNTDVRQRMSLYRGVYPLLTHNRNLYSINRVEELVQSIEQDILEAGLVNIGDIVVIASATHFPNLGRTNILKIHVVNG